MSMMLPVLRPFQKIPKRKQAESKPGQAEGQVLVRRSTSGQGLQVGARDADRADSREQTGTHFPCGGPARATATSPDHARESGLAPVEPFLGVSSLNWPGLKGSGVFLASPHARQLGRARTFSTSDQYQP